MKKQFPDHALFIKHLVYYALYAIIWAAFLMGAGAVAVFIAFQILKFLS
jgi:hypothetical protein